MELLPLLKVQNCAGRAYRADRAERADSTDRADRKNTFIFVYKIETMTDQLTQRSDPLKRLANLKISDGPKCLK